MKNRKTTRVWIVLLAFVLSLHTSTALRAESAGKAKETDKSKAEYEEYLKWKDSKQASSKDRLDEGGHEKGSTAGDTLVLIGGIGLLTTYVTTVVVGLVGPSSTSKDYLIPVVGPFLQSGKVSSPYDTLNILSGAFQAGFLATLGIGLAMKAGEPSDSKVTIVPVLTPRQAGVLAAWRL
jgi:hypothetical protein